MNGTLLQVLSSEALLLMCLRTNGKTIKGVEELRNEGPRERGDMGIRMNELA